MSTNKKDIIRNLILILITIFGLFTIIASGGGSSSVSGDGTTDGGTDTGTENQPPTVSIVSPETGSTYLPNEYITFIGNAVDYKGNAITGTNLSWTSSKVSSILSSGQEMRTTLALGDHTITLRAEDAYGNFSSTSIKVTISKQTANTPPTVSITLPVDGSQYNAGEYVPFEAEAYDAEDGYLEGDQVVWYSTLDGLLSTGRTFTKNDLSGGTHKIYFIAKDNEGLEKTTSSVSVKIANTAPVATITWPAAGSTYTVGDTIKFTGTGTDAEDGDLDGSSLEWSSTAYTNGTFGYGSEVSVSFLPAGAQTITLKVKDKNGGIDIDSIDITIN